MQLKTLLNRVQKHSSFVYETVRLVEHPRLAIEVEVRPRANARAKCSQCGRVAPGDDTLPPRLRIPVKVITHSGGKVISESGQSDHRSERSDAGVGL